MDETMVSDRTMTAVVTGASAGVGRATALAFARRGWRVALIARSPLGLDGAKREIEALGGEAAAFPADVANAEAVFAAADQIADLWGIIDVWVNNAMVTIFSPVSDISPAEFRRVTEVTYLGYVFGTMAALKHMRSRNAGTIVQVGSALSYRAIPLQSAYCGAKFASRAFTEALRSELQHDKSAVRLTMVHLPAVNTPQFDWGRNKLGYRTQPLPPIHQPERMADLIVRAAQSAPRELWVGLPTAKTVLGAMFAPGLLDKLLARKGYTGQITAEALPPDQIDNLFEPAPAGHVTRGRFDHQAKKHALSINPAAVRGSLAVIAVLLILAAILMTAAPIVVDF
jgi:NAD(P)-dependent dehydrogenase (short-subunit alcohol dehydrogenase family)